MLTIGSVRGIVIISVRRHGDAPSTSAASMRSFGMELKPPSWITVASGRIRQTLTMMTDAIARPGTPSQYRFVPEPRSDVAVRATRGTGAPSRWG